MTFPHLLETQGRGGTCPQNASGCPVAHRRAFPLVSIRPDGGSVLGGLLGGFLGVSALVAVVPLSAPPPACGVSQCGGNMFRQNCGRKPLQDKDLPDRAVPAVTIPVTISQVVAPCLCPAYFLLMCCLGYDTCRQYHTGRECGPVSGRWSGACFRYSAGDSIRTPAQRPA